MGRQKYLREKVNQLNHLDIDQPLLILGFCKNHPPTHPPYWTPYPNAVNVISEALTQKNHDLRGSLKSYMKPNLTWQNLTSVFYPSGHGL